MNPDILLWRVLVVLLLLNAVLDAVLPHWYWTSAAWLAAAVLSKKLFLSDNWRHK